MNFLEKYNLKQRSLFLSVTLALMLLIIGITVVIFINRISNLKSLINNTHELNSDILEMEKLKTELISLKAHPVEFYETGESDLTIQNKEYTEKIIKKLEKLTENSYADEYELTPLITKLKKDIIQYQNTLIKIIENLKLIGNNEYGLILQLKQSAGEIEKTMQNIPENPDINERISLIFSLEGDFINEKKSEYYDESINTTEDLINNLKKETKGETENLYDKQKLIDELSIYKTNFERLFYTLVENGLTKEDGLSGKIADIISISITELNDAQTDLTERTQNAVSRIYIYLFILVTVLIALTVIFVIWYYNSISTPVSEIQSDLTELKNGKIPEIALFEGTNEFSDIKKTIDQHSKNLNEKLTFIDEIKKGSLETKFKIVSEKDALGQSLIDLQNYLYKSNVEEKERKKAEEIEDWIKSGLAKFGEILRENTNNLENLTTNVITHLVKYLDALQGGFFIYNDSVINDIHLELYASYAYDRKKYFTKKVQLLEGLVGICAVEKNIMNLNKFPEDYITVTSGFGAAKPQNLIIFPLLIGNEIFGVIEIASFNEFNKFQVEFIQKLSEDIAITLSHVKINGQTKILLAQMQLQAEENKTKEDQIKNELSVSQENEEELREKLANAEQKVNELIEEKKKIEAKYRLLLKASKSI